MAAVRPTRSRGPRLAAAERRQVILEAAVTAFSESGYRATRVSDVAARVGVTEPVVFQNFGTKAELFSAALDTATRTVLDSLEQEAPTDALTMLGAFLDPQHQEELHGPGGIGMLFADAYSDSAEPPVIAAAQRCGGLLLRRFAEIVRRGQDAGSIRADVSADAISSMVFSMINSRAFRRRAAGDRDLAADEQEFVQALLRLLSPV